MRKFVILAALLSSISLSAFGQAQLIQDGDFEAPIFTPTWSISGAGISVPSNPAGAHGGTHYLQLGNVAGLQVVYQSIVIPADGAVGVLSYYYNILSQTGSGSPADSFQVVIRRDDGSPIALVDSKDGTDFDAGAGGSFYHLRTFSLDLRPYAGQTIRISFEAQDSPTGSGTIFDIDDVTFLLGRITELPPNDYFTNRTTIPTNTSQVLGTNIFATKESGETNHANNPGGKSIWWTWTAPTNGVLQLNTVGSTFAALLAAYEGSSISNLTRLAANNGANQSDGFARVTFAVTSQSQIQIAVDGFNDGSAVYAGVVVLNLAFKPDTNAPTVVISSPTANAKTTNTTVTVKGTATDNVGVALVQYRLENAAGTNDYLDAVGTNQWSGIVSNLVAGPNTIRARAYDTSSNLSLTVIRTFTYAAVSPLDLSTTGNGHVSPNYSNALLELGKSYTLTATPAAGSIFSNWISNGSIAATTPKLTFTMESNLVLQANFVPNPFTRVKGNYAGLFYDTGGITISNAGYFSAVLADKGTFSSKWQFAGTTYSLSGAFAADGSFSNAIARRGLSPLTVQLQLDLSGDETITGTISDGNWTADLAANRAHFSKTTPAPQSGNYTLVIPGSDDSSAAPGGDSIGTIKVDTSGNITLAGTLGDGTKISQRTFLSRDGQWPLFASLYAKQGLLIGWLTFDANQPNSDVNGPVSWIKLPQANSKLYPAGFDLDGIEALGSEYSFASGVSLVNWTDGQVVLENGNLSQSITNGLSIDSNNKITGTNKLSLSFTTSTGLFHGNVTNPDTGKPIAVNGVLLQKQNLGFGYFLGTNQTGSVTLGPQ